MFKLKHWRASTAINGWKAAPVLGFAILAGGCALPDETVTSHYETLDAARKDHLFDRGWLPDLLPSSSINIRTSNDLDINISEGSFHFAAADYAGFTHKQDATIPRSSPYARWDRTVESYRRKKYQTWHVSADGGHWVFFCNERRDYCEYRSWHRK